MWIDFKEVLDNTEFIMREHVPTVLLQDIPDTKQNRAQLAFLRKQQFARDAIAEGYDPDKPISEQIRNNGKLGSWK